MLALIAIAVILVFYDNVAVATTPPEQQERGEQQVASDGGLFAVLNGGRFTSGDTITVIGTVEERAIDSYVAIEVIDPESHTVESAYPDVTADNTFTYSFTAGEAEGVFGQPLTLSGN